MSGVSGVYHGYPLIQALTASRAQAYEHVRVKAILAHSHFYHHFRLSLFNSTTSFNPNMVQWLSIEPLVFAHRPAVFYDHVKRNLSDQMRYLSQVWPSFIIFIACDCPLCASTDKDNQVLMFDKLSINSFQFNQPYA